MKRKLCVTDIFNENPNKKFKPETLLSLSSEALWEQFLLAKDKEQYRDAVKFFSEMHQRGYFKANNIFIADAPCSLLIKKLEYTFIDFHEHHITGLQYVLGLGYAVNYEEAMAHFHLAAKQGHSGAQFFLGRCYLNLHKIRNYDQAIYWYKKAAEQGYINAQNSLGVIFANEKEIRYKEIEAVIWFKKAAEQGHAEAQNYLGYAFTTGIGVNKNLAEAYTWFKKAARQGHVEAQFSIGDMLAFGDGVSQDFKKALGWFKKAAEKGNTNAQYKLGCAFTHGKGVAQDSKVAFEWFKKSAHQGHSGAQCSLGFAFANGEGVTQNLKKSFDWYKKAADQGNANAQYSLGIAFEKAEGVSKNLKEAFFWYKKAAEQGNADAQIYLGDAFSKGEEVAQDLKEAFDWYKKAAEQGLAIAQNKLACALAKGEGVTQNLKEAFNWYKKSAEQGYAAAQHNLGCAFAKGNGVTKDLKEAFLWLKKAAEQGVGEAQCNFGFAFASGWSGVKDLKEAVFWFRKSAEQEIERALNYLKKLGTPLALYTVAGLEKKQEEQIKILLTHEDVEQAFLKEDFLKVTIIYKEPSEFLNCLQHQAKIRNKDITSFIINWVIRIDMELRSKGIIRNESLALWLTSLINEIEWPEVKREHIEPLMYFFCLQYLENDTYTNAETSFFIEPLLKLWYKGQSFDYYPQDPATNRLFASVLIHYYFKGQYELPGSCIINQGILGLLVCFCDNILPDCMEIQLLIVSLNLIKVKPSIIYVLLQLKNFFTSVNQVKENSQSFFSVIYNALRVLEGHENNNSLCSTVFSDIKIAAAQILAAQPSFFPVPVTIEERKLAVLLVNNDFVHLLEWIHEMKDISSQQNSICFTNI